jgi:hypothetical protein
MTFDVLGISRNDPTIHQYLEEMRYAALTHPTPAIC